MSKKNDDNKQNFINFKNSSKQNFFNVNKNQIINNHDKDNLDNNNLQNPKRLTMVDKPSANLSINNNTGNINVKYFHNKKNFLFTKIIIRLSYDADHKTKKKKISLGIKNL